MPWIEKTEPPAELPARYEIARMVRACDFGAADLDHAIARRKHFTHHREILLGYQKAIDCRDTQRFLKEEAADALKNYRAWQFVVDFLQGKPNMWNWRFPGVSEEIAPFLDSAFMQMLGFG